MSLLFKEWSAIVFKEKLRLIVFLCFNRRTKKFSYYLRNFSSVLWAHVIISCFSLLLSSGLLAFPQKNGERLEFGRGAEACAQVPWS